MAFLTKSAYALRMMEHLVGLVIGSCPPKGGIGASMATIRMG